MTAAEKPLGQKAYGHIGHLPGSRMGPGDHQVNEGQARIATAKVRDRHDRVWVQEKLDGSCVAVALLNGVLIPLGRSGYTAISSPHEQHHLFAEWVYANEDRFRGVLTESERLVGEWLAMAHGTRYDLSDRDPFVAFDLMRNTERVCVPEFYERVAHRFATPHLLNGGEPLSIPVAFDRLNTFGYYGALEPVEGAVWRVERDGKVDFLCKYVRPDKIDGKYFAERAGEDVWNWRPERAA